MAFHSHGRLGETVPAKGCNGRDGRSAPSGEWVVNDPKIRSSNEDFQRRCRDGKTQETYPCKDIGDDKVQSETNVTGKK